MSNNENDIKAPDGYLLGGRRRVRQNGTILFQRGWWELPKEVLADFIGEDVWVHILDPNGLGERGQPDVLEVAHPGLHIYDARVMKPPHTVIAERNKRPDAKHGCRKAMHKSWHEHRKG